MMRRATTAAPRGKLPSTVRSGKARIRKLMTIPSATRPYARPCSREMGMVLKKPLRITMHDKYRGGEETLPSSPLCGVYFPLLRLPCSSQSLSAPSSARVAGNLRALQLARASS